jgi:glycerophosphoryl diester phosphodiesterase
VVIERDAGSGATAVFRNVYEVSLTAAPGATLGKELLVDLVHIPDPAGVSLPAIHFGDIGIGDPFSVVCESIEAIYPVRGRDLVLGCDNNFPNTGRNPSLADDNELVVVSLRPDGRRGDA